MVLQVILNIMHGSGSHWVMLQVILNIIYGSGMEVPLGVIAGNSKYDVWLRNVSVTGCC